MINDTTFIANITRYCNYFERRNNWHKTPVTTLYNQNLLGLLEIQYENGGNFLYEIKVKQ